MKWLRLYHDTPNDPKWRLVAVRSGQPVGNVLAVWMHMLVNASESGERGTLADWNDEIVAAVLGYPPDAVSAIRGAMQGLVLDGDTLTGWEKRQRDGSDDAAERKRRSRASKQEKSPPNGTGGGGHGPNGADRDGPVTVTGQSRDNDGMSRDNPEMSRDRHVTPSRATQTLDYRKKEADEARVRAREGVIDGICDKIEEMTGLDGRDPANRQRVADWIGRGYDPDLDILPAVEGKLASTSVPLERIERFGFFHNAIERWRRLRIDPRPARGPALRVVQGGRSMEDGAAEWLEGLEQAKRGLS